MENLALIRDLAFNKENMVHVQVTNCQNLVNRQHPSLTSIHANCFYIVHGISLRHWEIHLNCTIATSCNQILLIEWKIQTVYSHHISKIYFYWPMYASITDRITENKWAQFTHTFWLKMQGTPCFIVLPMCNLYFTSSDLLDSTIMTELCSAMLSQSSTCQSKKARLAPPYPWDSLKFCISPSQSLTCASWDVRWLIDLYRVKCPIPLD